MNEYIELKIVGDDFGSAVNGMTMTESQSTKELELISESENQKIYQNKHGHKVTLHKRACVDATEYYTTFENLSDISTTLEMISSFALSDIKCDKIYRLKSFWSAEGKLKIETIHDLHLEKSWSGYSTRCEKFGSIGSYPTRKYFPFIALEDSENAEFIAIQLYSPSSWQIEVCCQSDTVTVTGGIADYDFGHWCKTVQPKEVFTTPRAKVATGKSLSEVCDKLVKAQLPEISPVDEDMPIVFNEYCTTWGNPSYDNIKKISETLKGKGVKYFVMDAGWYGNGNQWHLEQGNWVADPQKIPNGLKSITDCIRENGMIPGIWFEFEAVGRLAEQFNMTDHLLKRNGVTITTGNKRFWDMEDPWVQEYLTESVIKTLKNNGFGYIKVDYNDSIGVGCDGYESLGEGLRKKVLASQEFFKRIKREIPDIVIENCASGGNRLEPSMMELVSQASFSDAHETMSIPIIAANLHRVIKPSQSQIWSVMKPEQDHDRFHYLLCATFLGRMCLSGSVTNLSDAQWDIINQAIAFYGSVKHIIKNGFSSLINCSAISYNRPIGQQLVIRELGDEMLVVYHRFEKSEKIDESIFAGYDVVKTFGKADKDFTAVAYLARKHQK